MICHEVVVDGLFRLVANGHWIREKRRKRIFLVEAPVIFFFILASMTQNIDQLYTDDYFTLNQEFIKQKFLKYIYFAYTKSRLNRKSIVLWKMILAPQLMSVLVLTCELS